MNKKYRMEEARFAEPEEMIAENSCVDISEKYITTGGIPIRSDGEIMYVDGADTRTLTIAASGAGKTRRIIMPMMITLAKSLSSMVVHDPKGELLKITHDLLVECGYEIKVINFRDPQKGDRYNPLYYPAKLYKDGDISKGVEYFFEFSSSLYEPVKSSKDPFWTNVSENYLTGLCKLACEIMPIEYINIDNIYHLHVQGNERFGGSTYFREYFNKRKDSDTWRLLEATVMAPNDTKASIISVMSQVLSRLVANDDLLDLLSEMDWNVEEIAEKPMAVFLVTKDEGTLYNGIVSAIIQQIYVALVDVADNKYGGVLPRRVEFVMDEFGNMKIQDVNEKITASRSRNIRWHLVIQSLQQLSMKYSEQEAKILLGNCDDWIYLFSTDIELIKHISDRCGEYVSEYTNERRRLLPVSTLQHLDKKLGECLILQGRNYPYISYLPDISEYIYKFKEYNISYEKKRVQKERCHFDFQQIIKKEKDELLQKLKAESENILSDMRGTCYFDEISRMNSVNCKEPNEKRQSKGEKVTERERKEIEERKET